jgi:hypothetical protein
VQEKSDHYWPTDSEPKYYGDLQVVIMNETHLPDWTITEFRVCLVSVAVNQVDTKPVTE